MPLTPEPILLRQFCVIGDDRDGKVVCLIDTEAHGPGEWGILLADLLRHLGLAFETATGAHPNKTIAEVRALFEAEMARPTDFPNRIGDDDAPYA